MKKANDYAESDNLRGVRAIALEVCPGCNNSQRQEIRPAEQTLCEYSSQMYAHNGESRWFEIGQRMAEPLIARAGRVSVSREFERVVE